MEDQIKEEPKKREKDYKAGSEICSCWIIEHGNRFGFAKSVNLDFWSWSRWMGFYSFQGCFLCGGCSE